MAVRKTKHDIDKEVMFNKIMPSLGVADTDDDTTDVKPRTRKNSANKKTKSATDTSNAAVEEKTEEKPKSKRGRKPASKNPEAVTSDAESDNTQEKTDTKKQNKKSNESASIKEPATKNADNSEYEVINLNEELMNLHFDEIFQKFNHCHCNACHFTVMALALNELETNYVAVKTSEKKKILLKADDSEVKSAVIQAILKLIINPIHD